MAGKKPQKLSDKTKKDMVKGGMLGKAKDALNKLKSKIDEALKKSGV